MKRYWLLALALLTITVTAYGAPWFQPPGGSANDIRDTDRVLIEQDGVSRTATRGQLIKGTAWVHGAVDLETDQTVKGFKNFSGGFKTAYVVAKGPALDIRYFMDGKSGRPTIAQWRASGSLDVSSVLTAAFAAADVVDLGNYQFYTGDTRFSIPDGKALIGNGAKLRGLFSFGSNSYFKGVTFEVNATDFPGYAGENVLQTGGRSVSDTVIEGCKFALLAEYTGSGNSTAVVRLDGPVSGFKFLRNDVTAPSARHNGLKMVSAPPTITDTDVEIAYNNFHDIGQMGLEIWSSSSDGSEGASSIGANIHHNVFKNTGTVEQSINGMGISLAGYNNSPQVAFNTFDSCYGYGLELHAANVNGRVHHNIFKNFAHSHMIRSSSSWTTQNSGMDISHNTFMNGALLSRVSLTNMHNSSISLNTFYNVDHLEINGDKNNVLGNTFVLPLDSLPIVLTAATNSKVSFNRLIDPTFSLYELVRLNGAGTSRNTISDNIMDLASGGAPCGASSGSPPSPQNSATDPDTNIVARNIMNKAAGITEQSPVLNSLAVAGFTNSIVFNSSAGFNGSLIDIQVDGVSKFKVNQNGQVTAQNALLGTLVAALADDNQLTVQTRSFTAAGTSVKMATGTATNASGLFNPVLIAPIYNQSGTASSSDLQIKRTETALGSNAHKFADFIVGATSKWGVDHLGITFEGVGGAVSSASTIAPTGPIFHVTGTTAVNTISTPWGGFTGCVKIIPDAAFTTGTSGNIALASTAIVNKMLQMCYDGTKWYPSY